MKIIGIIGCGVVGLSGLRLFVKKSFYLRDFLGLAANEPIVFKIWDQKEVPLSEEQYLKEHQIMWITQDQMSLAAFVDMVDWALVSPGVNLSQVLNSRHKFICELDIFAAFFKGLTVAITGSLGKTTITKLIHQIFSRFLNQGESNNQLVALGGNVGIGMLDLIGQESQASWAVLELSSFQLELSKLFNPHIAVWTNLFPNHLDRHGSMSAYFASKANLFLTQKLTGFSIIGDQLFDTAIYAETLSMINSLQSELIIAGCRLMPSEKLMNDISHHKWTAWGEHQGWLVKWHVAAGKLIDTREVIDLEKLPSCTFRQNWAIIFAALESAGVSLSWLVEDLQKNPEEYYPKNSPHRLEFLGSKVSGIDFYNDSKSTVKEATLAAARQLALSYESIYVIIGGLGKGVCRKSFGNELKSIEGVTRVVAFGKEAADLAADVVVNSLEEAVQEVLHKVTVKTAVLFSPGGSSFDFFKNYEHRGDCFKLLVSQLLN